MREGSALFVTASVLLLVACSPAKHMTRGGMAPGIDTSDIVTGRVYILAVSDGVEREDGTAPGTGLAIGVALRDELLIHGVKPMLSETRELEAGFAAAERIGYEYVLRGMLTEWEDNATAWSLKRDTAELSLELYRVDSKELIGAATHRIEGYMGMGAAFVTPQTSRFVPELVGVTVARLFGWRSGYQRR